MTSAASRAYQSGSAFFGSGWMRRFFIGCWISLSAEESAEGVRRTPVFMSPLVGNDFRAWHRLRTNIRKSETIDMLASS
jgi:hypothetical protein